VPERDLVVVGGGPAGLSAATVAAVDGWTVSVVDAEGGGGRLYKLDDVHDYPRVGAVVAGPDLAGDLVDAAVAAGVDVVFDRVRSVTPSSAGSSSVPRSSVPPSSVGPSSARSSSAGSSWTVECDGEPLVAAAVVFATGHADAILGLPGENELRGRGLSYCASCDGMLFAAKRVAVIGVGNWAVDEALQLSQHAGQTTLLCPEPALASTRLRRTRLASAGIEVMVGATATALDRQDGKLAGIEISSAAGPSRLDIDGLFPLYAMAPALDAAPKAVVSGDVRRIVVNANGASAAAGLFAAGDVTHTRDGFVSEAIADGVRAGTAVSVYLQQIVAE
jgi:thioredoxin reductase (NADPH)